MFFPFAIAALGFLGLVSAARVSSDGQCGSANGRTCLGSRFGNCCSQYGYCGSTKAYCRSGCQSGFGSCNGVSSSVPQRSTLPTAVRSSTQRSSMLPTSTRVSPASPSSTQTVSTNARCGPQYGGRTCLGSKWGNCCSQYSYCGRTSDYCAPDTCQVGYGLCNSASSSTFKTSTSRSSSGLQSSSSTVLSTQISSSIVVPSSALSSSSSSIQSSTVQSSSILSSSSMQPSSSSVASTQDSSTPVISSSTSMDSSSSPVPSNTQSSTIESLSIQSSTLEASTAVSQTSSSVTSSSSPSASCGPGTRGFSVTSSYTLSTASSLDACEALCLAHSCKTFAVSTTTVTNIACYLFMLPIDQVLSANTASMFAFYDASTCGTSSSSSTILPSSTPASSSSDVSSTSPVLLSTSTSLAATSTSDVPSSSFTPSSSDMSSFSSSSVASSALVTSTTLALSSTTFSSVSSVPVPSSTCVQLVVNGDFETGNYSPWDTWHASPGDSPTYSVVADPTGSGYVYQYQGGSGDSSHILQRTSNVPAGSTLSCSFKYMTSGSPSSFDIGIYINGMYCGKSTQTSESTFETVTGSIVTQSNNPDLMVVWDYGPYVSLYIDEVSICLVSSTAQAATSQSSSIQSPTTDPTSSSSSSTDSSIAQPSTSSISMTTNSDASISIQSTSSATPTPSSSSITMGSDVPSSSSSSALQTSTSQGSNTIVTLTSSSVSSTQSSNLPPSTILSLDLPASSSTLATSVSSSSTSTTSAAASCTTTWLTSSDATCFTLTGHGQSLIEGELLGASKGLGSPAFVGYSGFTPATWTIDSNGYITIVSSVMNGYTLIQQNNPPDFFRMGPVATASNYPTSYRPVCTLSTTDDSFSCCRGSTCSFVLNNSSSYKGKLQSYVPMFGASGTSYASITMTYNIVSCFTTTCSNPS